MTGDNIHLLKPNLKSPNRMKVKKVSPECKVLPTELQTDSIRNENSNLSLPIPKGDTPYALAKIAEYKERNLDKAEFFYRQAIRRGERVISAIKDLASLMHQRGKTKEACEFLLCHSHVFRNNYEPFENLYNTLAKQVSATGNSQNKSLKISNLSPDDSEFHVRSLFFNPVRMQSINFAKEEVDGKIAYYCIVKFNSHSSARKTLEGFRSWDKYKVEWVSMYGEPAGDAHYARQKMDEYRKHHPTFDYSLFERDPQGYVFCLPVDNLENEFKWQISEQENPAENLLGKALFSTIFTEKNVDYYC